MNITRVDIYWNYCATFLKIASSAILLPLLLRMMPSDMIGVWSIFMTITAFVSMLDFGFNPSFCRNVTYIFSGVKSLRSKGYELVSLETDSIDYGLLKGLIASMRWFYSYMALAVLALLTTFGTLYLQKILAHYKESHSDVYIAWTILCLINVYNIYTLYYDALLEGKGLIKRAKQIIIIGQTAYLFVATIMLLAKFGLIAIVSAQAVSAIIVRYLSYHFFFTKEIKEHLKESKPRKKNEIFRAVYPNAVKIGLSSLGGFMVTRSAIIIGSLYLTLDQIASYGITMQLIRIISGLAGIYLATYQPKIVQLRVKEEHSQIRQLYINGQILLLATFIGGGLALIFLGNIGFQFIGSKTTLMPASIISIALFVALEEANLGIAGNILLTKNEVPFFKASLISGGLIIIGLFLGFRFLKFGLMGMVLVPLIIDLGYQAWKWPMEVLRDLNMTGRSYLKSSKQIILK